jgi:hypothetical protein
MVPCPGRPLAGKADPGPVGETPRMTSCHPFGRAEPAPPRGASLGERPWGVNPGITRRVLFSEGRTLCVRMARPYECRGIPFSPDDEARGRLAYRAHSSVKPVPSYPGVRSPPLRGGLAWLRWPWRVNPGITRRVFFSEGRTLCVRVVRPSGCPGISFRPDP